MTYTGEQTYNGQQRQWNEALVVGIDAAVVRVRPAATASSRDGWIAGWITAWMND